MPQIKDKAYHIFVNEDRSLLEQKIAEIDPSSVFIIVDNNTHKHCLPSIKKLKCFQKAEIILLPPGEMFKSLVTCSDIWDELLEKNADRESLIVNLGGGVIGDMGGFAASVYMRGLRFIHIPTTLLAQADASIGGKTGIDYKIHKNLIGSFGFPEFVWIETPFLKTLSQRELRSGFAEMIKHALLSSRERWSALKALKDIYKIENLEKLIVESVNTKTAITSKDFNEKGLRKVLNFGHTIGHAIESYSMKHNNILLHGEAVALGMIAESYISFKKSGLPENDFRDISRYIRSIYKDLPVLSLNSAQILAFLTSDKKNSKGANRFVLLKSIGQPVYNMQVEKKIIISSLDLLSAYPNI